MKNKTLNILFAIVAVFDFGISAFAQATQPTRTTLASAMSAGSSTMVVSSATGFTVTTNGVNNYVLVEKDLRRIQAISGTTITLFGANIGGLGVQAAHPSGATVVFGPTGNWQVNSRASNGVFLQSMPTGTCARADQRFLPAFVILAANPATAAMVDCLGGKWTPGTLPDNPDATPLVLASNVPIGSVAYASFGSSTTGISTVEWLTSIMVPKSGFITGVKVLCGATCTTDKILAILRDSSGNVLANAAVAGVLLSGASTFQTQNFTSQIFVVGPARYFIGVQTNGNTVGDLNLVAASTFPDVVTGQLTGGTFGTIVNPATMPSTFTAGNGPIVELIY